MIRSFLNKPFYGEWTFLQTVGFFLVIYPLAVALSLIIIFLREDDDDDNVLLEDEKEVDAGGNLLHLPPARADDGRKGEPS